MKVKVEIQQRGTPVESNHDVEKQKKETENQREIVLEEALSCLVCVS